MTSQQHCSNVIMMASKGYCYDNKVIYQSSALEFNRSKAIDTASPGLMFSKSTDLSWWWPFVLCSRGEGLLSGESSSRVDGGVLFNLLRETKGGENDINETVKGSFPLVHFAKLGK